jgi:hypothetical protein
MGGGGAFIALQGNLAAGVSKMWTCKGRGPDMSNHHLWNPAKKPDKAGVFRDKAERPNMFGQGAGHVWVRSLEPSLVTRYVRSWDLVA